MKVRGPKKLVEHILSSASKMSKLIDDILNFSKITTIDVEFKMVDLDKKLQEVISDFDVIINQKKSSYKSS
jgi:light-regulated signal transduction histidine kinase (bacteriophytochrome)